MITLDQVLLLQKKVETAVTKIADLNSSVLQLTKENDALRSKCAELTKALSEKSEQVSSLENDQDKIERGILSALDRLSTVENSVLNGAGSTSSNLEQNVQDSQDSLTNEVQEEVLTEENVSPSEQTKVQEAEMDTSFEIF